VSRPYVVLSCAVSLDGYLDDAGPERLMLSNDADLDRVDAERAGVDAILVGAQTVRRDDPRLLVRDPARQRPDEPVKVCLTTSGGLDPSARFFTEGEVPKIVYCPSERADALIGVLPATVVGLGAAPLDLGAVLDDLGERGVRRLMVEGGGWVLTQFLTADLADELQLAIAPVIVADERAPRFSRPGPTTAKPGRLHLEEVRQLDDVVLLRYLRAR
jgi:5-amino-6-(5-phosphoribosylamino)uracil reductase